MPFLSSQFVESSNQACLGKNQLWRVVLFSQQILLCCCSERSTHPQETTHKKHLSLTWVGLPFCLSVHPKSNCRWVAAGRQLQRSCRTHELVAVSWAIDGELTEFVMLCRTRVVAVPEVLLRTYEISSSPRRYNLHARYVLHLQLRPNFRENWWRCCFLGCGFWDFGLVLMGGGIVKGQTDCDSRVAWNILFEKFERRCFCVLGGGGGTSGAVFWSFCQLCVPMLRTRIVSGECLWLHLDLIKEMQDFCKDLYPVVDYAYCTIPTYPSGQIGFVLCSTNPVSCQIPHINTTFWVRSQCFTSVRGGPWRSRPGSVPCSIYFVPKSKVFAHQHRDSIPPGHKLQTTFEKVAGWRLGQVRLEVLQHGHPQSKFRSSDVCQKGELARFFNHAAKLSFTRLPTSISSFLLFVAEIAAREWFGMTRLCLPGYFFHTIHRNQSVDRELWSLGECIWDGIVKE